MKRLSRVVVQQELSTSSLDRGIVTIPLEGEHPKVILRSVHEDEALQRRLGGTYVVVEFEPRAHDVLQWAYEGFLIAADFLTAISLASGIQLGDTAFVEGTGPVETSGRRPFVRFLTFEERRWHRPITADELLRVRSIVAHWDRDGAARIRRATHAYAQALGSDDQIEAFVSAYTGLEALDPPLAREAGLKPGVEVVEGQCLACGVKYEKNRTALVGVRAFIKDRMPEALGASEWKDLSDLRHKIVHGLKDREDTSTRAARLLPAVLHHLHDALMHLSHQHNEEGEPYGVPKTIKPVFLGDLRSELTRLEAWRGPLLEVRDIRWVPHGEYGYLPEFPAFNDGHVFGPVRIGYLNKRFGEATEGDIEPLRFEQDGEAP